MPKPNGGWAATLHSYDPVEPRHPDGRDRWICRRHPGVGVCTYWTGWCKRCHDPDAPPTHEEVGLEEAPAWWRPYPRQWPLPVLACDYHKHRTFEVGRVCVDCIDEDDEQGED